MNIRDVSGAFSRLIFSLSRWLASLLPARRILAFGMGEAKIGAIMVINLDASRSGGYAYVANWLASERLTVPRCFRSRAGWPPWMHVTVEPSPRPVTSTRSTVLVTSFMFNRTLDY